MDGRQIAFGKSSPEVWSLADEELLKSIAWSRSAPSRAVDAAREGDVSNAFRALCKAGFGIVSAKGRKHALRRPEKRSLWSRLAFETSESTDELVRFWENWRQSPRRMLSGEAKRKQHHTESKKRRRAVQEEVSNFDRWIERAGRRKKVAPLELLILLEILQQTGSELPAEIGWRAWRLALAAALELGEIGDPRDDSALTTDQRLLALGELPVAAGAVFSCVKKSGKLIQAGAKYLSEQLEANTDTDGMPNAKLLTRISIWLAPLVRATEWARSADETLWDKSSAERFGLLLERAAAICRPAGQLALSNGRSCGVAGLLSDASRLAGWKKKSPPSRYVAAVGNGESKGMKSHRPSGSGDDRPATQSDWARFAFLRNNWSATPDTLVVAHHCDKPLLDLTTLGRPLLSGHWDLEITIDGNPVALKEDWECTCWFSDDDADFLELHMDLESGVKIERQVLLSREGHFALLTDVVSGPENCPVVYTSRLPLVKNLEGDADTITRECTLKCKGLHARVFPLALPDDRLVGTSGSFAADRGALVLKQQADGGLLAPVLIDWNPEHRREAADWRTLTVTEEGRVLKRSVASGYRIRIGDDQLVYYRSLRNSGEMRAIIGHHTAHETIIGRFDDEGVVDPILIVEAQEPASANPSG